MACTAFEKNPGTSPQATSWIEEPRTRLNHTKGERLVVQKAGPDVMPGQLILGESCRYIWVCTRCGVTFVPMEEVESDE